MMFNQTSESTASNSAVLGKARSAQALASDDPQVVSESGCIGKPRFLALGCAKATDPSHPAGNVSLATKPDYDKPDPLTTLMQSLQCWCGGHYDTVTHTMIGRSDKWLSPSPPFKFHPPAQVPTGDFDFTLTGHYVTIGGPHTIRPIRQAPEHLEKTSVAVGTRYDRGDGVAVLGEYHHLLMYYNPYTRSATRPMPLCFRTVALMHPNLLRLDFVNFWVSVVAFTEEIVTLSIVCTRCSFDPLTIAHRPVENAKHAAMLYAAADMRGILGTAIHYCLFLRHHSHTLVHRVELRGGVISRFGVTLSPPTVGHARSYLVHECLRRDHPGDIKPHALTIARRDGLPVRIRLLRSCVEPNPGPVEPSPVLLGVYASISDIQVVRITKFYDDRYALQNPINGMLHRLACVHCRPHFKRVHITPNDPWCQVCHPLPTTIAIHHYYYLNPRTRVYHYGDCRYIGKDYTATQTPPIGIPCSVCRPPTPSTQQPPPPVLRPLIQNINTGMVHSANCRTISTCRSLRRPTGEYRLCRVCKPTLLELRPYEEDLTTECVERNPGPYDRLRHWLEHVDYAFVVYVYYCVLDLYTAQLPHGHLPLIYTLITTALLLPALCHKPRMLVLVMIRLLTNNDDLDDHFAHASTSEFATLTATLTIYMLTYSSIIGYHFLAAIESMVRQMLGNTSLRRFDYTARSTIMLLPAAILSTSLTTAYIVITVAFTRAFPWMATVATLVQALLSAFQWKLHNALKWIVFCCFITATITTPMPLTAAGPTLVIGSVPTVVSRVAQSSLIRLTGKRLPDSHELTLVLSLSIASPLLGTCIRPACRAAGVFFDDLVDGLTINSSGRELVGLSGVLCLTAIMAAVIWLSRGEFGPLRTVIHRHRHKISLASALLCTFALTYSMVLRLRNFFGVAHNALLLDLTEEDMDTIRRNVQYYIVTLPAFMAFTIASSLGLFTVVGISLASFVLLLVVLFCFSEEGWFTVCLAMTCVVSALMAPQYMLYWLIEWFLSWIPWSMLRSVTRFPFLCIYGALVCVDVCILGVWYFMLRALSHGPATIEADDCEPIPDGEEDMPIFDSSQPPTPRTESSTSYDTTNSEDDPPDPLSNCSSTLPTYGDLPVRGPGKNKGKKGARDCGLASCADNMADFVFNLKDGPLPVIPPNFVHEHTVREDWYPEFKWLLPHLEQRNLILVDAQHKHHPDNLDCFPRSVLTLTQLLTPDGINARRVHNFLDRLSKVKVPRVHDVPICLAIDAFKSLKLPTRFGLVLAHSTPNGGVRLLEFDKDDCKLDHHLIITLDKASQLSHACVLVGSYVADGLMFETDEEEAGPPPTPPPQQHAKTKAPNILDTCPQDFKIFMRELSYLLRLNDRGRHPQQTIPSISQHDLDSYTEPERYKRFVELQCALYVKRVKKIIRDYHPDAANGDEQLFKLATNFRANLYHPRLFQYLYKLYNARYEDYRKVFVWSIPKELHMWPSMVDINYNTPDPTHAPDDDRVDDNTWQHLFMRPRERKQDGESNPTTCPTSESPPTKTNAEATKPPFRIPLEIPRYYTSGHGENWAGLEALLEKVLEPEDPVVITTPSDGDGERNKCPYLYTDVGHVRVSDGVCECRTCDGFDFDTKVYEFTQAAWSLLCAVWRQYRDATRDAATRRRLRRNLYRAHVLGRDVYFPSVRLVRPALVRHCGLLRADVLANQRYFKRLAWAYVNLYNLFWRDFGNGALRSFFRCFNLSIAWRPHETYYRAPGCNCTTIFLGCGPTDPAQTYVMDNMLYANSYSLKYAPARYDSQWHGKHGPTMRLYDDSVVDRDDPELPFLTIPLLREAITIGQRTFYDKVIAREGPFVIVQPSMSLVSDPIDDIYEPLPVTKVDHGDEQLFYIHALDNAYLVPSNVLARLRRCINGKDQLAAIEYLTEIGPVFAIELDPTEATVFYHNLYHVLTPRQSTPVGPYYDAPVFGGTSYGIGVSVPGQGIRAKVCQGFCDKYPPSTTFRWRHHVCPECQPLWRHAKSNSQPEFVQTYCSQNYPQSMPTGTHPLSGPVVLEQTLAIPKVKPFIDDAHPTRAEGFEIPRQVPMKVAYGPYGWGILLAHHMPTVFSKHTYNETVAVLYRLYAKRRYVPNPISWGVVPGLLMQLIYSPHRTTIVHMQPSMPVLCHHDLMADVSDGLLSREDYLTILDRWPVAKMGPRAWLSCFPPSRRMQLYRVMVNTTNGSDVTWYMRKRRFTFIIKSELGPNSKTIASKHRKCNDPTHDYTFQASWYGADAPCMYCVADPMDNPANPRTILTPNDISHVHAGCHLKTMTHNLSAAWDNLYGLCYAGHLRPEQLDEWISEGVRLVGHQLVLEYPTWCYVEIDYTSFDSTYSPLALRTITRQLYPWLTNEGNLHPRVVECMDYWANVDAHSRNQTKFKRRHINASGRDDTALLNAATNGVVLAISIAAVLHEVQPGAVTPAMLDRTLALSRVIMLGDDSVSHIPRTTIYGHEWSPDLLNEFIGSFGFEAKTKIHANPLAVTFLGRRPYVNSNHTLSWARTVGRAMYKHGWCRVPNLPPKVWLRSIAQGTYINDSVNPLLRAVAEKELSLVGPGLHCDLERDTWFHRKKEIIGCKHCWAAQALEVYNVTSEELSEVMEQVKLVDRLPCALSHRAWDAFVAADN